MKRNDMDFDAAMAFLNVSRSTLNRWIVDGKLSPRKVGGQWRFSADDLKNLRDGSGVPAPLLRAREDLRHFLESARTPRKELAPMIAADPQSLAEALVWEACDRKATDLHLQPRRDGVHVAFRIEGRLEAVRVIPADLARELELAWDGIGLPFGESGIRRIFLSREASESINEISVMSQALDTLQGRRVTLRFMGGARVTDLDTAVPRKKDRAIFQSWLAKFRGVILFAGLPGSGKTTTLLSCLQSLAKNAGSAVFSLEYPVVIRVDGVDQVEVAKDDAPTVTAAIERIQRMAPNALGICLETPETAAAAHRLASTGHLVLMQIEAAGHADAVARFEKLAGKPAAGLLIGVISQRLKRANSGGWVAEYQFWEAPKGG